MNSVSYGWWLDNLYQFNDPDIMVFGNGADTNEAQSRLISGAVTGLMLDGDDLTVSNGENAAQEFLTNPAIDDVARVGQTFTTVEGNSGSSAENIFVRQDGMSWCIAVFNYTSGATNETVELTRAGLPPGNYIATNLWDGTTWMVTNSFNVILNAKQSKLFRLTARLQASSQPIISNLTVSGGSLIFSGTNGIASGNYVVLISTNVATPLTNWTPLATNAFDANGNFLATNTISPDNSQQFYRIQL